MAQSQPLEEFAAAPTAESRSEAVLALLKNKDLHRALETRAFQRGMQRLVERTGGGRSRLVALSTLGRIGAVTKSAQPLIARHLTQALEQPLSA
jgi:hypothetical protein